MVPMDLFDWRYNANLMVAAPEMERALIEFVSWRDALHNNPSLCGAGHANYVNELEKMARAALVKTSVRTKHGEKRGDYTFWTRPVAGETKPLYQVTKNDSPPKGDGGYFDLDYLLKVKGLR